MKQCTYLRYEAMYIFMIYSKIQMKIFSYIVMTF